MLQKTAHLIRAFLKQAAPYDSAVFDEGSNAWKMTDTNGYVRLYKDKPSPANYTKFLYEHRKVMEDQLKRQLLLSEIIHHIDRNRSNNAPENLQLILDHLTHVREEHPEWRIRKNVPQNVQRQLPPPPANTPAPAAA